MRCSALLKDLLHSEQVNLGLAESTITGISSRVEFVEMSLCDVIERRQEVVNILLHTSMDESHVLVGWTDDAMSRADALCTGMKSHDGNVWR